MIIIAIKFFIDNHRNRLFFSAYKNDKKVFKMEAQNGKKTAAAATRPPRQHIRKPPPCKHKILDLEKS